MNLMPAALFPLAFVNSVWGWAVILFIGLLLFGSRLPSVARNMGKGINEFKKGLNEGLSDDDRSRGDESGPARPAADASKKKSDVSDIEETSV